MAVGSRVAALALACALAACAGDASRRHDVSVRSTADVVDLAPYVGRLVTVEARVGDVPLRLLFDTGAGLSALTPAAAARVGCAAAGRSTGWRMDGERVDLPLCRGVRLTLGQRAVDLERYGIFDLARVLPPELPPVDGILGLDAFAALDVTIEFAAHRLAIASPGRARSDGGWVSVPSRIATGADGTMRVAFLRATVPDGSDRWLELDSGNLDAVRLSPDTARALAIDAGAATPRADLRLGSLTTGSLDARVHELIVDGALDAAFFVRFDVQVQARDAGVRLRPRAP